MRKKDGIQDASYISGMNKWVSGRHVVPFTELGKSGRKTCWQRKERVKRCEMNQFSLKPVKSEICGRHPGREVREAVGRQQLKIEVEREEADGSEHPQS